MLGLLASVLFVYASVGRFGFVNWDDNVYVLNNRHVLAGLSWPNVWWALRTAQSPYWHPLTWLSHLTDVTLFGLDAGGHHLTNLVFHVANTMLVYLIFRGLTGEVFRSGFVAATFGVHPLHVESVAWIAERKDVLSAFFVLLTIVGYTRYVRRRGGVRYVGVVALFACALMAKPMAVTLPILLLVLDVWPFGRVTWTSALREWQPLFVEKIPLIALAAGVAVATVIVQADVGAMASVSSLSWSLRVQNALVGYLVYCWQTLWPVDLAPFYPLRVWSGSVIVTAGALLVAVTSLAFAVRRRYPWILAGWCWFIVGVLPVSGLLQSGEQATADRFMYLPMIGLLFGVAWTVAPEGRPQVLAHMSAWTAVLVICLLAITAKAQAATWANSVALWDHAVRATRDNFMALQKLGDALVEDGDFAGAVEHYNQALAAAPPDAVKYHAVIHNGKGLALMHEGHMADAIGEFELSVQEDGHFAEARLNLGNELAAAAKLDAAEAEFREALRLQPDLPEAHVGLGAILLQSHRPSEAAREFREAIQLQPNLAEAHNDLGSALALQGEFDAARAEYEAAISLKPSLATAHMNLGILLVRTGDTARAAEELQQALSEDPSLQAARRALELIKK